MIGAWQLKYAGKTRAKVEELKRLGVVEESKQNTLEEEKFKLKLGEASDAISNTKEKIKEIEVKASGSAKHIKLLRRYDEQLRDRTELMMLEHARMSTRAATVLQNHIKAQDIHISLLDEVIEERGARIKILED